jgi:hypothetical protein
LPCAPDTYFCQSSEILRATVELPHWERFTKCVDEIRSRNSGVLEIVWRRAIPAFWYARRPIGFGGSSLIAAVWRYWCRVAGSRFRNCRHHPRHAILGHSSKCERCIVDNHHHFSIVCHSLSGYGHPVALVLCTAPSFLEPFVGGRTREKITQVGWGGCLVSTSLTKSAALYLWGIGPDRFGRAGLGNPMRGLSVEREGSPCM